MVCVLVEGVFKKAWGGYTCVGVNDKSCTLVGVTIE